MADEAPKLIVDDDWKSEAKREKERLSAQASSSGKQEPGEKKGAGTPEDLSFTDIVRTFASQAALYLGLIPEPQSQQRVFAPEYARMNIDFLGLLEQKTKGNLSDEEQKELTQTAAELRSLYVETTAAVKQAMDEGKIPSSGPGVPGGPLGGEGGDLRTPQG